MGVRTKFLLLLLSLNLPLIAIGQFVIQRGEEAVRENLGATFQRMAAESIDKVDRALFDIQRNVKTWAGLEVMQEVLTGDFDGRVSTFLIDVSRAYGNLHGVDVMDERGNIVASSDPIRVGLSPPIRGIDEVLGGTGTVEDIRQVDHEEVWVVEMCEPIRAAYEPSLIVGAICVRWDAFELDRLSRVSLPNQQDPAGVAILLIRRDGEVISAPRSFDIRSHRDSLREWGWAAAGGDHDGERGFTVERIPGGGSFLVGFCRSSGYEDLRPLGWAAVVLQDVDTAYAPVRAIRQFIVTVWVPVTLVVIGLSLLLSHRFTRPLVEMARVAERVADGDFQQRVDVQSSDEIGSLARAFNQMVDQLDSQRARLIEDIAMQRATEVELRLAKETAEKSTARFRSVLNTMGEGLIAIDAEGIVTMANEEAESIWGYRSDEIVGESVEELIDPNDRGVHRGAFLEFLRGDVSRKVRIETRGRRKSGELFPLEISAAVTTESDRNFVTAAVRDITDRRRAEEQISSALSEKEALLREVHHRVKNNLQVIISLLHLQSDYLVDDAGRRLLLDSENRVRSMALMHERLYQSKTLAHIDAKDYIESLCTDLGRSYSVGSSDIVMKLDVEDVVLGMDTAIHCGLLISELVSNAVKHAFPSSGSGTIRVALEHVGERKFELRVSDDGVGMPPDFDTEAADSLGLQLVSTLAEHLNGSARNVPASGGGVAFIVSFEDIDEAVS